MIAHEHHEYLKEEHKKHKTKYTDKENFGFEMPIVDRLWLFLLGLLGFSEVALE